MVSRLHGVSGFRTFSEPRGINDIGARLLWAMMTAMAVLLWSLPASDSSLAAGLFPRPAIPWEPELYTCLRADGPVILDGHPDEAAWEPAPWTGDFVDIQGPGLPTPRFRTRVKMIWDDAFFYVAAELEEPDVWGSLTKRDAVIYHDNDFEVFIDPDGDTHDYYELEVNALGTVWDLLLLKPYRDGGPAVNAWDIAGLRTAVAVNGTLNHPGDVDRGWSVEVAFPWKVLMECAGRATPPVDGDRWRVNFSRVEWRSRASEGPNGAVYGKLTDPATGRWLPEDNWVWSPQGLIAMHYPEMWGIVVFSESATAAPGGAPDWGRPPRPRTSGTGTSGTDAPGTGAPVSGGNFTHSTPAPTGAEHRHPYTPVERAGAALYRLYYAERDWQAAHDEWTDDLAALGLNEPPLPGIPWPPALRRTASLFEAVLTLPAGPSVHIREDGRLWTTP